MNLGVIRLHLQDRLKIDTWELGTLHILQAQSTKSKQAKIKRRLRKIKAEQTLTALTYPPPLGPLTGFLGFSEGTPRNGAAEVRLRPERPRELRERLRVYSFEGPLHRRTCRPVLCSFEL